MYILWGCSGTLPHSNLPVFLVFLCLRSAGLPGDGDWNELKWNVAMASVTLGNCKQGLQWRGEEVLWWWVGNASRFGLNITKGNMQVQNQNGTQNQRGGLL